MAIVKLSPKQLIHLTSNSGLRLRSDDKRITQLGKPACPLIVVESDEMFIPYVSQHSILITVGASNTEITSDDLLALGRFETLNAAVRAYLDCHSSSKISDRSRHVPIQRAITLDMWLPNGQIAHNYADAIRLVKELAQRQLGKGMLLYIPGWHAPYDTGYPAYKPSEALGGTQQFSDLIRIATDHGICVMPHLNFWAYDVSSSLLPDYMDYQVRDDEGKPMGWPGILRTGYTNPLAYMRIDDTRWQDVFFRFVEPLVTELDIQALFLDQLSFNVPMAPAFDAALLSMLDRLLALKPNLLLGGEFIDERLFHRVRLFQSWGQPWCGVEQDFTDSFSPIVAMLFGNDLALISHLGLPCATPCRYCWTNYPFIVQQGHKVAFKLAQEHRRAIGGLPHVRLDYNRFGIDDQSLAVLQENQGCD
jgi:hypothetical protein